MSKWRVVPAEPTPEILTISRRWTGHTDAASKLLWGEFLSAAPAFEPDDAMVNSTMSVLNNAGVFPGFRVVREALKAAFEEVEP